MGGGGGVLVKVMMTWMVCMAMVADAEISCATVNNKLMPCVNYLCRGREIPSSCCDGVRELNSLSRSTTDRQTACRCLQDAARRFPTLDAARAAGLPRACHVTIPYPISLRTDCNSVK